MLGARRLRAVAAASGPEVEQRRIRVDHLAHAIGEAERGGEEDVGGGAALDEIGRQVVASLAAVVIEHPLRGRRAVIDVARVDVGAVLEEQIDDGARLREVERRLAVAAALVHARRILLDHAREEIDAVEMRGGARVGDRTRGEEPVRGVAGGDVQRVEGARPPLAPPIRIGAELEEHVDHREVVRALRRSPAS